MRTAEYAPVVTTAERYAKDWAKKVRDAIASRNRWMGQMSDDGASVRQIAKAVGLPPTTVDRILRQQRGEQ